jgi:hypothetical protein
MNREGAKFAKKRAKISFFHLPGVRQVKKRIVSWRTWRLGGLDLYFSPWADEGT